MAFANNVFVNCPFDDDYKKLLRAILFCILYLGFEPRIASERSDSGESRIDKIVELIVDSRFGLHDLSRLKASRKGEMFRLNMPFELGIDYGCRLFKGGQWASKKILILEAENHRFKAAISDLSGSDIAAHRDEAATACDEVRNWLAQELGNDTPGPSAVWGRFNEFMSDNYVTLTGRGYSATDIEKQPIRELIGCIRDWVALHPWR